MTFHIGRLKSLNTWQKSTYRLLIQVDPTLSTLILANCEVWPINLGKLFFCCIYAWEYLIICCYIEWQDIITPIISKWCTYSLDFVCWRSRNKGELIESIIITKQKTFLRFNRVWTRIWIKSRSCSFWRSIWFSNFIVLLSLT